MQWLIVTRTTVLNEAGIESLSRVVTNSVPPKVFVLILSYNGRRWLEECLPSVLQMDYPNFEVVVIDNGSSDGTGEYLQSEFPDVQNVRIFPNVGYSRGFDAGLVYAAARGAEYFLIMNNDTVIDRGALTALIETATAMDHAGFITGKVYFHARPDVFQCVGKEEDPVRWNGNYMGFGEIDTGQYEEITERVWVDDVYVLVSRKMYDEIGGYDTQYFFQCEEWDWQIRAKKKGWHIYYTPAAKIWHRVSATIGGAGGPISEYFLQRNWVVVIARHGGGKRFIRYVAVSCYEDFKGLLGAIFRLNATMLKPRLARFLGFLAGISWLLHRHPPTRVPRLIQWLAEK